MPRVRGEGQRISKTPRIMDVLWETLVDEMLPSHLAGCRISPDKRSSMYEVCTYVSAFPSRHYPASSSFLVVPSAHSPMENDMGATTPAMQNVFETNGNRRTRSSSEHVDIGRGC